MTRLTRVLQFLRKVLRFQELPIQKKLYLLLELFGIVLYYNSLAVLEIFLWAKNRLLLLSFIRNAYNEFDNDWRIHADNIILNERVSLASVLYINDPKGVSENGTAFYEHHLHGKELSECVSEEEYNRLILEDSNDLTKWLETDYVKSKPNRLLKYSANYFHSKSPNKIEKGVRIVMATFYKKLQSDN